MDAVGRQWEKRNAAHGNERRARHLVLAYIVSILIALALCIGLTVEPAAAGLTELVSVDSTGAQANAGSTLSAVSADGRYVAFASLASNLVPNDTNGQFDIFVHDRVSGTTERVSVDSNGVEANGRSLNPVISADGRYVAFVSQATNLVPGDTNGHFDVFVHDRVSGTTERVSVDSSGQQGNQDSLNPAISGDGRFVAFASASAFVSGDTNGKFDVFVRDRVAQTTERVSVDSNGIESNGQSLAPAISNDGTVVAFESDATNLVSGDNNAHKDVFVHDRTTGATYLVSVSSQGAAGDGDSMAAAISADGRFVVFNSNATTFVPGDTNVRTDVFVRDRVNQTTESVSVTPSGAQGNDMSGSTDHAAISADGRFVAFTSMASDLVDDDTNFALDEFVRDRAAGVTVRVSVASDGSEGNAGAVSSPAISADGRFVVFASSSSNLVPNDTNGAQDIFVHDRSCGNGVLDPGEQCDDGNLVDGDGCSSQCTLEAVCGNGILEPGEECDDGNTLDGDCCSSKCKLEPAGSPCSDGNACTTVDQCDGSGQCVGSAPVVCPAPADACHAQGVCDPTTGSCSNPAVPDGTPCSDGDTCTTGDACVAGSCVAGTPNAAACLDPFKCYPSYTDWRWNSSKPMNVTLTSASGSMPVQIVGSTSFCNPVSENGSPIMDPTAHLACYRVGVSSDTARQCRAHKRSFYARDVFGRHSLTVAAPPSRLCVPAELNGVQSKLNLDSYACYPATGTMLQVTVKPTQATLADQFETKKTVILQPLAMCQPVSLGQKPVLHPVAGFTCFEIVDALTRPWQPFFTPRRATVDDVFGDHLLNVFAPHKLCVPATLSQ
ncbi:MAG TPA: DUF4215 domain-containing protein [Candidatus Bathyarchaeia archaeon]|nr:DUF4215 domain-containing protein [Candidatus Bathyarchaeia archaeon]